MKVVALATAAIIVATIRSAGAFDFASRPKECLELTARVVRETGGEFRPGGEHGDTVEVGSIIIQIDCGFSPATMSVEIGADSKYPDNQWYAIAARAGYALTGDPVASIEKAARRCILADLTSPNRTSEADLPKTHLLCYDWAGETGQDLTLELQARFSDYEMSKFGRAA